MSIIGSRLIGIVHALIVRAMGAVFNAKLQPLCELLCTTTASGGAQNAPRLFNRPIGDRRDLIDDHRVACTLIAAPERSIAFSGHARTCFPNSNAV